MTAGQDLGDAFATGMEASFDHVEATAQAIARQWPRRKEGENVMTMTAESVARESEEPLDLLTPERAEKLLATRAINRPLKEAKVAYLKRQLEIGRWHPTAGTIGVNEDGQLVDGQHRCAAVAASGVTVEIATRLIRSQDVLAVDTGSMRTPGDLFAIRNVDHHSTTVATIRLVANLRGSIGRPRISTQPGRLLSNEELWEIVKADPNYIVSASIGQTLSETTPFLSPGYIAGLHYVFAEAGGSEKAREFLDDVAQDRVNAPDSLTHALRLWLLRGEAAKRKPTKLEGVAVVLGAWNRWIRGERSGRVQLPKKIQPVAALRRETLDLPVDPDAA